MSDYTPSTEQVRDAYESGSNLFRETEAQHFGIVPPTDYGAEFWRWLAAHDRETAARAWDEGFEEPRECCGLCPLRSCPWDNGGDGPTNPYREGGTP